MSHTAGSLWMVSIPFLKELTALTTSVPEQRPPSLSLRLAPEVRRQEDELDSPDDPRHKVEVYDEDEETQNEQDEEDCSDVHEVPSVSKTDEQLE